MINIEAEVRAGQFRLASEVGDLGYDVLRKLLPDNCHEQDDPYDDPKGEYSRRSDLDFDEDDIPVVRRIERPRDSFADAVLRLVLLHDHTYDDGRVEPIITPQWYDTLDLRSQVRIAAIRVSLRTLDATELGYLERCLHRVRKHMDDAVDREPSTPSEVRSRAKPEWNKDIGELSVDGVLVKTFSQPAPNQRRVLNAFQEEEWPRRVDDPLPFSHEIDPKRRLSETVRSLNDNRKNDALHFECDGTGEGVIWSTSN